jgi:cytochrome d ubiquinol oxidase subunit II
METVWFILVTFMLTVYVILDGFDLGAGALHLLLARNNQERKTLLAAIGPVWDGNEVWLIAAGATLYFAFPALFAAAFSGFYLPLHMILWLLIGRGCGIEFRAHVDHPLWQAFFDFIYSIASLLLTVFLGAALGNVVRGVPLDNDGFFFEPLWTTFTVTSEAGILDWFTVLIGILAFFTLCMHGAHYLATKTEGELNIRARQAAAALWWGVAVFTFVGLFAVLSIRPHMMDNYVTYPAGVVFPLAMIGSLAAIPHFRARGREAQAFISSSIYIASMLAGTAFGLYPILLPSSTDPILSLTVHNAATGRYAQGVGLIWWITGMVLALGYFYYIYHHFRGKVRA